MDSSTYYVQQIYFLAVCCTVHVLETKVQKYIVVKLWKMTVKKCGGGIICFTFIVSQSLPPKCFKWLSLVLFPKQESWKMSSEHLKNCVCVVLFLRQLFAKECLARICVFYVVLYVYM